MTKETAMKILKELHGKSLFAERTALETLIPELKNKDDEIRKALVEMVHDTTGDELWVDYNVHKEEALAWLEKQGEQKPTSDTRYEVKAGGSLSVNGKPFDYEHATITQKDFAPKDYHNIDPHFGISVEDLMSKKNSADKPEPKFHEDDWVVYIGTTAKIFDLQKHYYVGKDTNGKDFIVSYCYEHAMKKWDISDAKNGDVVVDKSDGTIGIFQSIGHHPDGGSFNDPSYCFLHCHYDDGFFYADFEDGNIMDSYDAIPATKEQRDLLFTAMKEAGYQWDAEKKELKKIEDGIEIPFGAKDSELQEETYYIPKGFHAEIDDDKVIIKKGEKPAAWSDKDENMAEDLIKGCVSSEKAHHFIHTPKEVADWLKSLKDRIGG